MKGSAILVVSLMQGCTHLKAGRIHFDDEYLQVSWLNGKMLVLFEMILPSPPLFIHQVNTLITCLPSLCSVELTLSADALETLFLHICGWRSLAVTR